MLYDEVVMVVDSCWQRKKKRKLEELWLQFIHPKTKPTILHSRTIKLHTCITVFILSPETLKAFKQLLNKNEIKMQFLTKKLK